MYSQNSARNNRMRCRRVFRITEEREKIFKLGLVDSDLSPCIHMLFLAGIFPQRKETKESCCITLLRKSITAMIHIYWTYIFFISFFTTIRLSQQFKTDFTMSVVNVLTAIIRFAVHQKRNKIYPAIESIENFYLIFPNKGYKARKSVIQTLCYAGILAAIIMTIISVEHLKVKGQYESYSRDFILGLNTTQNVSYFVEYFPYAILITTIFCHHFIPLLICLYICSTFHILRKAVTKFIDTIKHDRQTGNSDLTVYMSEYNRMMAVVSEIDDLLGIPIFFSIGCLISNQLCVMNTLIIGEKKLLHPVSTFMECILSIKNAFIFLSITSFGAVLNEEIENVSTEIRKLIKVPGYDFQKLSLLLQNVNNSKISVTAWKMFTLKRNLVLTTASVITTYGMLLMQFHQQGKSN